MEETFKGPNHQDVAFILSRRALVLEEQVRVEIFTVWFPLSLWQRRDACCGRRFSCFNHKDILMYSDLTQTPFKTPFTLQLCIGLGTLLGGGAERIMFELIHVLLWVMIDWSSDLVLLIKPLRR